MMHIRYSVLEVCYQEGPVRGKDDGTGFWLALCRVLGWLWDNNPIRDVTWAGFRGKNTARYAQPTGILVHDIHGGLGSDGKDLVPCKRYDTIGVVLQEYSWQPPSPIVVDAMFHDPTVSVADEDRSGRCRIPADRAGWGVCLDPQRDFAEPRIRAIVDAHVVIVASTCKEAAARREGKKVDCIVVGISQRFG